MCVDVVPVFQCFFISVSTLGGAFFFRELDSFNAVQGVMFPIGLLMTLAGVLVLSSRQMGRRNVVHRGGQYQEQDAEAEVDTRLDQGSFSGRVERDGSNVALRHGIDSDSPDLNIELADLEDPKGRYAVLSPQRTNSEADSTPTHHERRDSRASQRSRPTTPLTAVMVDSRASSARPSPGTP
jgi:hypothetical protein